jgi:CRP-like cAMP-binding protein/phosphoribosyl 1,2-cyclic phosphodiesterase
VSRFEAAQLPRGGLLVSCPGFAIQIGAYPETIKDTMAAESGVPDLFLVPESLFDLKHGLSSAELEFPLYYNFYIKQRRLRILCRSHQARPVLRVLREALMGPLRLEHQNEYAQGSKTIGFPDLQAEMAYFKADPRLPKGKLRLSDCLKPLTFSDHCPIVVDGVEITSLGGDRYQFRQDGDELIVCYQSQTSREHYAKIAPAGEKSRFVPPNFGITMVGSGHGFDINSNTSGFIVWVLGRGILVDPPIDTTIWLENEGIDARRIEDVILTHCHADHDSGTLQAILLEGRVNLYTTETILKSFERKYRTLTGLSSRQFLSLFNFCPVLIDQETNILGAEFRFKYRFHTIPTIGFETFFGGRSFVYSSDTLYDPALCRKLCERGIMSESRCEDLLDFPWYHSLVLHEAGMPPVHTPIAQLAALNEDVLQNLYLTHLSESSIPATSGLKLAKTGVDQTLILQEQGTSLDRTHQILDVLAHVDMFKDLKVSKALEFLRVVVYSRHAPGKRIIATGEPGEHFYMVISGAADVLKNGECVRTYGRYDYFGELALVENQLRSADIVARTELELLRMGRYDFFNFLRGTTLVNHFRKVGRNRQLVPAELWERHPILGALSSFQQGQLLALMGHVQLVEGQCLYQRGEMVQDYFLILDGEVFLDDGAQQIVAGRGTVLGTIGRNLELPAHEFTATLAANCDLCQLPGLEVVRFFRDNPGVYLRLLQFVGCQEQRYWL